MKKVLAIAPYPYLPYYSGGQKFIARFLENLGKETNLTVIGTPGNDWTMARNYSVLPLLKRSFSRYFDRSLISKISTEVRNGGYDTVIWEHPYFAWLANRVKKRTGARMIIHTHNIEHQRFHSMGRWWWPILKRYEKWAMQKADTILFITPEDKAYVVETWNIIKEKCIDLPFGVDIENFPSDRASCANSMRTKHGIAWDEKVLFFNGLLDYKPNSDALKAILHEVNPVLLASPGFHYKIIICGKGLDPELNELKEWANKNIIFAGFTENIAPYYKATDIFLNPVQSGGGIKTKMVEAIAYGCTVIATETGASGIVKSVCGEKLVTVPDDRWNAFAQAILENASHPTTTPAEYYSYYYWGNIIKNLLRELPELPPTALKDE